MPTMNFFSTCKNGDVFAFFLPKVHLSRRLFLGGGSFSQVEKPRHGKSHHFWKGKGWGCFDFETGSLLESIWIISVKKWCPRISKLVFISDTSLRPTWTWHFFQKATVPSHFNSCLSSSLHVLRYSSPTKSFWVFWVPEKKCRVLHLVCSEIHVWP